MEKIAIVISHTSDSKGACSPWLDCEYSYNKKVAEELLLLDPEKYKLFFHDTYKNGYYAMIKRTAERLNKENFSLIIGLDYNSASESAQGCEVLYCSGSKTGEKYARIFCEGISQKMKVKNRGIKPLKTKNDRGFWLVYLPKAPVIDLEPFFGSNKEDSLKFVNPAKYAGVLHDIILKL